MNEIYTYGGMEEAAEVGIALGLFLMVYCLFALIWGIAAYVLQSVGVYTIAKRRQIRNPWLAWIPVASTYMQGCISDQYQHVVNKRTTRRRIVLLVGMIVYALICGGFFGSFIGMITEMVSADMAQGYMSEDQMLQMFMGPVASIMGWSSVVSIVSIVLAVFRYIVLYDLYASCWPNCKVGFLLLSIFIGISTPILVFICRKKDEGMIQVQHPVYPQYAPPAPQPEAPAPAPQQPAEDKEPWE